MFNGQRPPVTIKVVDWADEEGARFGRSLLGSSAASGSLQVHEVEALVDKTGVRLSTPCARTASSCRACTNRNNILKAIERQSVPRASYRAGPGARGGEQVRRRRDRDVRSRTAPASICRSSGAFGIDADPDASRRVSRRGGKCSCVPRDRAEAHHAHGSRRVHGRHRQGGTWDRHRGARRVRDLARSTGARCGRARADAGGGSCGIVANCRREQRLRRMEADLED